MISEAHESLVLVGKNPTADIGKELVLTDAGCIRLCRNLKIATDEQARNAALFTRGFIRNPPLMPPNRVMPAELSTFAEFLMHSGGVSECVDDDEDTGEIEF